MTGRPLDDDRLRLNHRLNTFIVWAVVLLTAGYSFLDYWAYSRVEHEDPRSWIALGTGCGLAPAQYRIGIYFTANALRHATRLRFHQIFAAADLLSTVIGLACLFYLLTSLPAFRCSKIEAQWAQVFLALLLAQFYLGWTLWFQEPETLPSLAVLAASLLLCSGQLRIARPMVAASLVLLAVLGATIRVDIAIAFHAGLLLVWLLSRKTAAGNGWLAGTSFISLIAAVSIERFISVHLFPSAARSAPLFQLLANLHALNGALVLLCTLAPWLLTLWLARRYWRDMSIWLRTVLLGSVVHFLLFITFGMSEEVRIFLPFLLALIPLSATVLYAWFAGLPA